MVSNAIIIVTILVATFAFASFLGLESAVTTATTSSPYTYFMNDSGGPTYPSAYIVPTVGTTSTKAGSGYTPWYISQWGNPVDLTVWNYSDNSACSSTPLWSIANPTTRICWIPVGNRYVVELHETGQNASYPLPCNNGGVGSGEFDLFLGEGNPYGGENQALFDTSYRHLNQLSSLNLSFGVQISYVSVLYRCGATNREFDQSTEALGLVFDAYNGTNNQAFFYQVTLNSADSQQANICSGSGLLASFQSDGTGTFIADDGLNAYGYPCIPVGGPRIYYNLNILPRLIYAIQNSPYSYFDKNISDWYFSGFYYGSRVYGSGTNTVLWDSINITGTISSQSPTTTTSTASSTSTTSSTTSMTTTTSATSTTTSITTTIPATSTSAIASTTSSTISTTTTTVPECKCSWFVCNQYCGDKSGNYCLLDSNCLGTTTTSSTTSPATSSNTSTTSTSPTTTTVSSSSTTTAIVQPAQPCSTYDIPCWIGYFFLRIFGLAK
jgi:hypothetical protein